MVLLAVDGVEIPDSLRSEISGPVAEELRHRGASRIQLNVVDPSLGPPHGIPPSRDLFQLAAMVSYWVPAAGEHGVHGDLLPAIGGGEWHGYLVVEALRLAGPPAPPGGERCTGFTQVVPLTVPGGMSWAEWRRRWQGSHTDVAIETQSSFRYVQNVVVRPLDDRAPAFAAVVEESFPLAAASDTAVFYDAEGDPERLELHSARMMKSCATFMDGSVPIAWTAEYRLFD